jgi:hypothetical protein
MIVYGDPETWGMTVDQFLDSRRLEQESFADGTNPKIKMILDMLRRGMDVDTISTITGATVEEINNIAKTAKPISTEELSSEKPLSKNKTYSEIDILSNIDAKNPSGITGEDIVTYPMPNPVPRMDEYMPEAEGMEDPRYRQLELAEGGIVERESFKDGINYTRNPTGKNQYKTKTLEEIIQIKESYPDNFRPKDFIGEGTLNNVEEKIGPAVRLLTKDDIKNAKKAGVMFPTGKRSDPEKERARDRTRREFIKSKSSPSMEKELKGTKEKNLSHAGRKNTPVNLGNLMYADADANVKMLYPFEKPLEEAMTKFEEIYNSDASPEVKRKAAFELQKFDRELRKKYPEYAKLKTRFQFKNSAFEPGFVFKEKLPDPSLAISNEPGTSLKGLIPKSKKGEALIKIGKEKLETLISNIGCPTGTLKASEGANCYIKGVEKIQSGNLNQNEFNILRKAVKSPAVANAIKYGGVALKGLGAALTPLVFYDTYTAYKEGKPISEALEYGLLGTNIIGGTRDEMKLTPQEREARGVQQQYEREQQDVSGLSSDFYVPSDLSVDQAAKIYEQGQNRVAAERAAEEEQVAGERIYEGDPGISDYSEYAYGGRVNFEKGSDPKDKPILPINPMIGGEDPRGSLQDPGRRDVLKGMGLLGAGVAAGKLGLLKLGKAIKKAPLTNIVKPMGATITNFPSWFPSLIKRFRKEGKQIPIYKEVEVTLTKPEYDKLSKEGVTVYDRHLGRTDWYKEKLIKEGVPRYYTDKKTDEIIGYKYEVKDLPGTIVKEMNGEEIRVYFPNAYGRNVEMTYKAPKVSVDMKGKKVKYDAEFEVNDAVPEMAGPEDVPDFFPGTVDNLDDVYGGASKIEQYATKAKQPRTTLGDEVVNRWDAGQPSMTVKELKVTRKQRRRAQAEAKAVELGKPSAFNDTEFLKDFYELGDDFD